jgi:hypothetical protein
MPYGHVKVLVKEGAHTTSSRVCGGEQEKPATKFQIMYTMKTINIMNNTLNIIAIMDII